ncbi:LysM peptidoglycan-binding domain-containing protein [Chitinophaga silvatica]|uniref:LysM peptidoglycan-binding domain-containing protein n=1 Tax=Chitinophaga silvatica TaxID=2282649 RepID=A0A3E1Y3U3_9BACT|nr:LysM peptidoglycan-binding domain-containing protein [Chitinophaga silvatica]RFS19326.1 LysM peptidoglycan-binding domain-containing protein [Chitinophaga silvatica]
MSNELDKVKITSYKSSTFKKDQKISSGDFTVLLNPEGYTRSYKIKYKEQQASGTKSQQMNFDKVEPEDIDMEFVFDKTGALPGTFKSKNQAGISEESKDGIWPDIIQFKKVVYDYKGVIHQPPYLIIQWGELIFKCVLKEMTINFKLFKPDGIPLRAIVKCKFTSTVENELRVRQQGDQSPDITHKRIVQAGDTLPMLCYKVYDDPAYYLQVAQANKLADFRNLTPGMELIFPPVQKT